jgi:hypothetical protein
MYTGLRSHWLHFLSPSLGTKQKFAFNSLSHFLRPTTLPFSTLYSDGIVNANAILLSIVKERL